MPLNLLGMQGVTMVVELNGSKILRLPQVCELVGLGRSTVYAKLAEGTFPVPVRLGPRAVGWRTRDILAWLEDSEREWDPSQAR